MKVSLITCDLKSASGPSGHWLAAAKVGNRPKAPRNRAGKVQRMASPSAGRQDALPQQLAAAASANIQAPHSVYLPCICPQISYGIQCKVTDFLSELLFTKPGLPRTQPLRFLTS